MGVRPLAFHQRRWDDGRTLLRAPLGRHDGRGLRLSRTTRPTAPTCWPRWSTPCRRSASTSGTASSAWTTTANGSRRSSRTALGRRRRPRRRRRHPLRRPQRAVRPRGAGVHRLRRLSRARARRSALRHLELEVTAQIWMGPGAHFVHYFVQQQRLVNFVAIFEQDSLDARVVDRSRRGGGRAGGVRGLAPAGARDHRRGRRDVHLGAVRPPAAAALVEGPSARCSATRATRCCRSWPRAPRRASRTARRSPPASSTARRPAGAGALRAAAAAARVEDPGDVEREQAPLPPARRAATSRSATRGWRAARPTSRCRRSSGSTSTSATSRGRV